jgi:hypothetical protein
VLQREGTAFSISMHDMCEGRGKRGFASEREEPPQNPH